MKKKRHKERQQKRKPKLKKSTKFLWIVSLIVGIFLIFMLIRATNFFSNEICGDVNSDGRITSSDMVVLINYIFKGGKDPSSMFSANVNGDDKVSAEDIVSLSSYIFTTKPTLKCVSVKTAKFDYTPEQVANYEKQLLDIGIDIEIE